MKTYETKESVLEQSQILLHKSLRDIVPKAEIEKVESEVFGYKNRKKGFLGELVEWYAFGKKPDGLSQPDFGVAGVELKTTPLKGHSKNKYVSKERLVFSMINYDEIVHETWEKS